MNEKIKSPSSQGGTGGGAGPPNNGGSTGPNIGGNNPVGPPPTTPGGSPSAGVGPPAPNNGSDPQAAQHLYGPPAGDPAMSHYHLHQQPHPSQQHMPHPQGGPPPPPPQNPGEHPNKDEYGQGPIGGGPPPPPGGHHPVYGRYHHPDPNIDPYRYGHAPIQQPPPGGKPQQQPNPPTGPGGALTSPNRPPPQRYIPGQPPQGPTPTLNSLLQSSHPPPPPQHRYSNSYDQQQQQQQQAAQQQQQGGPQGPHGPPPPQHQPYGTQQGVWAPPPRPYSPQMGPSQVYRTPPPTNSSRGQSPYPPTHGQNSGSYPSSPQQPQQPGGPPPPPQSSNQGTAPSQYSPYPQRYPTPPGPATGPNHRAAYSTHQYTEPNRPWPGGSSSPAPSPGPGGHPHPPASPHHLQHGGPPPSSSPGHAPSPSPQPSQASPSPHQELIGQNSNDSSSGGAHSGMGSGPPGTPNPQQVMRPTPSPTGSSGSRSMSPAVAQNHPISRPSSNQSSSGPMQQPGSAGPPPPLPHMSQSASGPQQQVAAPTSQSQQQNAIGGQNSSSSASNSPQQLQSGSTGSNNGQQPPPNQTVNNMPTPPPQSGPGAGVYPPPPHMHSGYKLGGPLPVPGSGQTPGPGPQGMPTGYPPPQQTQQYTQGNYPPRPQYPPNSYVPAPPQTNQPTSANSMPPGGPQQYPGRPMPNHSSSGPHAQYPPYQNWMPPSPQSAPGGPGSGAGASNMGNHVQGKGTPPPVGPQGGGSPRPLNYLKQHLQHKGGYGSSPTPPQGYGNGPGVHPGMPMGPPHHMGPPHGPTNMGPPTSTPPQPMVGGIPPGGDGSNSEHISQDNGISSSGSTASGPHPVTSVVTTGPDGTPMDEVSQQSTLSNASAASGEDPQCTTPKSRKTDPYSQSHLIPPSTSPGGHPGHPGAPGEEYEMSSPPNWTRTPASPVFNSHVPPQETFRSSNKKSDSLCKLYEMDENPERRGWLDKLRAFMEDRRTPITACPTISKQPLDLYRLYIYVKERGGFVEVTKSKTWKDIAGLLGIGASSSAAYTLRKHYTKNLLAFECHFDRGDIDPLPIIQQVEAGTKKKTTKPASVPSPGGGILDAINTPNTPAGSSNSQDAFPAPGGAPNTNIDGYPGYPGGYPGGGPQPDYGAGGQMQRPPSQSNAQAPHASSPYPGQPGAYGQYNSGDQYNATGPPGQFGQNQPQFPPQNRNMYPPYGPEGEAPPPGANQYGPYGNRPYNQQPPGSAPTTTPPVATNVPNAVGGPPTSGPATPGGAYPPGAPTQQDYYRPPDQTPQPRRHPDFVKDSQPYPGYNARPQIYGGWQAGSNQYRSQYPSSPSPQTWGGAPPRSAAPTAGPLGPPNQQASAAAQWEQHRYPPQQAPPPQQQPQYAQPQTQQQPPQPPQWAQMGTTQPPQVGTPGAPQRPPGTQQQRPGMPPQQQNATGPVPGQNMPSNMTKPQFSMPPPQTSSSGAPCGPPVPTGPTNAPLNALSAQKPTGPPTQLGGPIAQQNAAPFPQPAGIPLQKKEIIFPPDSVEATSPVLYRRKRLNKIEVCPIDPWRIFMAMRSGLLTECTWALDVLNVLLYDDTTVQYFGLSHLPGLLPLLLTHFQKNLAEMFDEGDEMESNPHCVRSICSYNRRRHYENNDIKEQQSNPDSIDNILDDDEGIDLGQIYQPPNPEERIMIFSNTFNYTLISRKGLPVKITPADDDIFVTDGLKLWDIDSDKQYELTAPTGSSAWTYGVTERDPYDGVIDVFKSEIIDIPFARYIRNKQQNSTDDEQKTGKDELVGSCNNNDMQIDNGDDEDSRLLKKFYKKRKFYNSTNNKNVSSNAASIGEGSNVKRSKFNSTNLDFAQPDSKKEQSDLDTTASTSASDSDCREIDMDLEAARLSNGANNLNKSFNKSNMREAASLEQRRRDSTYEDECYTRDEASLYLVNESQDSLARRCICLSNIFRNLTFVPGNEALLAKSTRFLAVLGRLLLLNHEHLQRTPKTRNYDREEDTDFSDSCSSLQGEREWWWDYLISIRENMLVAMANIAGHLELSRYEEIIARPLIDGLLHWAVCPSAHGQDPFPSCGPSSALSPQRLALEALCKLCVTDANVDLVIATPPHSRLEKLCAVLTRHLCRNEDQVLREFSVNLLHYLAAADSAMARTVALQSPCISYLVAFIEQAEQTALGVANQHGINYLRENPDSMGTSLDMLRRAAGTLLHLAKHPDNRLLFMQQEQRLLGLVMSHILDQQVALIISRVLFQVSRGAGPMPSMEYRLQQRQQNGERKAVSTDLKFEIKTETDAQRISNSNISTPTIANSSNSSSTTTSSSKPTNATHDENSNSSNQLTPAAAFNDVSNSSTNSNSCSTAASSHSNMSNSSTSSRHTNNIGETTLSTPAILSSTVTTNATNKEQLLTAGSNKNILSTSPALTANLNNSNISLHNTSNSNSSNSSTNSSNNSITAATAVAAAPTTPAPPTPTAPPATTTAAVA